MKDSTTVTNNDILAALAAVIEQRKQSGNADDSYVASLHAKGLDKILEKIGEESTEVIIAAKNARQAGSKNAGQQISQEDALAALIGETADLWFHSLVMLSQFDIDASPVLAELARRFGVSGIEEKAQRKSR